MIGDTDRSQEISDILASKAPENATYLAVNVNWEKMGIAPHLYIFDQFGKIVKKTNVDYVGGGYYEFEMSDNNTQNILIDTVIKRGFI